MDTPIDNKNENDSDTKSKILDYIHQRLCEWAEWALSDRKLGVGYPPCSMEYRLMTEGHVERAYLGLKRIPEHAAAEEMEALLIQMATQYPQIAEVIRANYLEEDGYIQKARRLGISPTVFKTHLSAGRCWLAGWFSGFSEKNTSKNVPTNKNKTP